MPEKDKPAEPGGDKSFSQADVDRFVANERRKHEDKLAEFETVKAKAEQFDQLDAANKSDLDRANQKIAQLEGDLATATARADRFEVALDKGLDMTRAKRLTGTTREELEADADELKGWTAATGDEGGSTKAPPGKPTENLRGGGDPTTEADDTDVRAVVADIPRGF